MGGGFSSSQAYNGVLSDVRIYNRVLSSAEVYQRSIGEELTVPETVAHYDLNAGSGTTLYDQSGNGHHGTINGATWVNTCPEEDLDGDGVAAWEDCDDNDASVPTVDDFNCDGFVDDCAGLEFGSNDSNFFKLGKLRI